MHETRPHEIEKELNAFLKQHKIRWQRFVHPPTFTVAEAKKLRGQLPGAHVKNLFLEDKKGGLYLVTVEENRRISMSALAQSLGSARLSFAKEALLAQVLNVAPGAVTPFALIHNRNNRITSFALDAKLLQADFLNFHPLHNRATYNIGRDDFINFLQALDIVPKKLGKEIFQ